MTKTQANEPGFVLVPRELTTAMTMAFHEASPHVPTGWTATKAWAAFLAAAPIVPAPSCGVKSLEWEAPYDGEDGNPVYGVVSPLGRYLATDEGWFIVGVTGWHKVAGLDEAKTAAQADFERRALSCLSSAPVEEADAKAWEPTPTAEFGHGRWIVDTGYHYGRPAVFIGPSPEPGPIGELVTNPEHKLPLDRLKYGEFFLTFPTDEQAKRVADALVTPPASTIPSEPEAKGDFLTRLRAANRARDAEYRAKTNGEPLPILFRTTEFAGEVGELLNIIKKMERERLGWGGKRTTREAMLEEFGGAFATFDLLAMSLDVDLAESTAAEFNAVTERLGLTTYLLAHPVEEPGEVERLTRERDEARKNFAFWEERENIALKRAETAEAALAETRERLEKMEAAR